MEAVTLKPLLHNGTENIGIYFTDVAALNKAVRKIKKARWTRTHQCWYVPLTKDKYDEIVLSFKGIAEIENSELKEFLYKKNKTEVRFLKLKSRSE